MPEPSDYPLHRQRGSLLRPVPVAAGSFGQTLGSAAVSVACHLCVLCLFGLVTWAVGAASESPSGEFHAALIAESADESKGGGFQFPGDAFIDRPDAPSDGNKDRALGDLTQQLTAGKAPQPRVLAMAGSELETLASQSLRRDDVVGLRAGEGEGSGSGLGDRNLAGGGPVGSLWGVGQGQQAASIVYVLDRSGSMSECFNLLQRELLQAIGSLGPDQRFNVFWFNEGKATEVFPKLSPATIANKRRVFESVKQVYPEGSTEPVDAIRRGLSCKPDVLFLLSDGDFGEQNKKIIATIDRLNKRRQTVINTILFVYDTMGEGERVLRAIAKANGGTYKHVTEEEVRGR